MIKTVFDKNILVTAAKTGPVLPAGETVWLKQKGSEVMKSLQRHFLPFLCVNQSVKAQSLFLSARHHLSGIKNKNTHLPTCNSLQSLLSGLFLREKGSWVPFFSPEFSKSTGFSPLYHTLAGPCS